MTRMKALAATGLVALALAAAPVTSAEAHRGDGLVGGLIAGTFLGAAAVASSPYYGAVVAPAPVYYGAPPVVYAAPPYAYYPGYYGYSPYYGYYYHGGYGYYGHGYYGHHGYHR